ncbi:MAG: mechanosensitive ion channel [Rhodocyclaceae bacterium]|nr:mechanosensitive ion channel [Rhodocyclaceae bacterium]
MDLVLSLPELERNLFKPAMLIELGVIALGLIAAGLIAWRARRRYRPADENTAQEQSFAHSSVQRLIFPLSGAALLLAARGVLRLMGVNTHVIAAVCILLLALAGIRMAVFALRRAFGNPAWVAGFEQIFALTIWTVFALHVLGILPELIDWAESIKFSIGKQKLDLWVLLQGALWVMVTLLAAMWLAGLLENRIMASGQLDFSLRIVLSRLVKTLLVFLAVLIALPIVGIDLTALSVFGGALGVGLGFGMQKIAASYVSGFIILLDRSIRIGNIVSIAGDRGQVTRITTRYTVLRKLTGVEVIVPNETLVSSVLVNESYTDQRVRLAMPFQVAYGTDLDVALKVLVDATRQQPRVLAEPAAGGLVDGFGDNGINLELGFWIADPHEGTAVLRSEINLFVWREFQRLGIQIPFPQREVRMLGTTDIALQPGGMAASTAPPPDKTA